MPRSTTETCSGFNKLIVSLLTHAHTLSLASHTLCREEGSGHAASIELSPRQKLDMTNQIHAVRRSHPLSWSSSYVTTCLADVSILLSYRYVS